MNVREPLPLESAKLSGAAGCEDFSFLPCFGRLAGGGTNADESTMVSGITTGGEELLSVVSRCSRGLFLDFFFVEGIFEEEGPGTGILPLAAKMSSISDFGIRTSRSCIIKCKKETD